MRKNVSYDFGGWVTRNDVKCSDGRTIRHGAFSDCDGKRVPLVWNHGHSDPDNVLGFVDLVCKPEGVYGNGSFNGNEKAQNAFQAIIHGDINGLSIWANQLKEKKGEVFHGNIREVSLVLAGANPEAYIDTIIAHGEDAPGEFFFALGENDSDIQMVHSEDGGEADSDADSADVDNDEDADEGEPDEVDDDYEDDEEDGDDNDDEEVSEEDLAAYSEEAYKSMTPAQQEAVDRMVEGIIENDPDIYLAQDTEDGEDEIAPEVRDAFASMNTAQLNAATYYMDKAIAHSAELSETNDDDYEEEESEMKHNVFENDERMDNYLTHSDEETILDLAKSTTVGSFKAAMEIFADQNNLQHDAIASGFYETGNNGTVYDLFPEYKEVRPGAPELLTSDQGWISVVMNKVHKSPISRIRTTTVDIRKIDELRAQGYKKGKQKAQTGNFGLVRRTTDPQTVFVKSALHRDDIVDITDFDYVQYLYNIDKMQLNEALATAIMIGDGRADSADGKIEETHIRPIWLDDELYTMHFDLTDDIKSSIQGSNTTGYFGENYVLAEAMINLCLYSREQHKGTGTPDMFITPHMLNVMLLARDRNGRRIYSSKSELATAFNVGNIYTAEQFENRTRTTTPAAGEPAKTKKLLALIVNLADYSLGATKGGEVTHFTQFDIDFNQQKSLLETRVSGALTRVYSAIAIEEDVTEAQSSGNNGNSSSNP